MKIVNLFYFFSFHRELWHDSHEKFYNIQLFIKNFMWSKNKMMVSFFNPWHHENHIILYLPRNLLQLGQVCSTSWKSGIQNGTQQQNHVTRKKNLKSKLFKFWIIPYSIKFEYRIILTIFVYWYYWWITYPQQNIAPQAAQAKIKEMNWNYHQTYRLKYP